MLYDEFIELVRQSRLSVQDICDYFKGSTKAEIEETLFKMFASAENDTGDAMTPRQEERYANVLKAVASIEKHYKVSLFDYKAMLQTESTHTHILPLQLQNDYFANVLSRLVNDGFMTEENGKYEWKETVCLLAYFIDKVTDKLELKPSNRRVPWSLFLWIANMESTGLANALSEWKSQNGRAIEPKGTRLIDDIIQGK